MWVLLWAKMGCASGLGSREERYTWVKDDSASDDMLKDEALDYLESISWMQGAERTSYGFERIGPTLPPEITLRKIRGYEAQIASAQASIEFLTKQLPAKPEPPKTRFERNLLPAKRARRV